LTGNGDLIRTNSGSAAVTITGTNHNRDVRWHIRRRGAHLRAVVPDAEPPAFSFMREIVCRSAPFGKAGPIVAGCSARPAADTIVWILRRPVVLNGCHKA
jgi:hypothetical protein